MGCSDDIREQDIVMDLSKALTTRKVHFHHDIPTGAAGLYSLIFVRCKPASASYHVNYKMDAVFVNPGPNYLPGTTADRLSHHPDPNPGHTVLCTLILNREEICLWKDLVLEDYTPFLIQ